MTPTSLTLTGRLMSIGQRYRAATLTLPGEPIGREVAAAIAAPLIAAGIGDVDAEVEIEIRLKGEKGR